VRNAYVDDTTSTSLTINSMMTYILLYKSSQILSKHRGFNDFYVNLDLVSKIESNLDLVSLVCQM
jgi:hypothetical protein